MAAAAAHRGRRLVKLFTIGYEGATQGDLIATLVAAG
jgi:hypothetical protein